MDAFIHCTTQVLLIYVFVFTTTPFRALLLTIKNTTLNHKLIVLVAQTFLRGRVALEAEIASLVGVNLRWVETKTEERENKRKLLFLSPALVKQQGKVHLNPNKMKLLVRSTNLGVLVVNKSISTGCI